MFEIVLRKAEDLETVSGILVMNGYSVTRTQIKNTDPKCKGHFTGLTVDGDGMLPKVSKEDTE